MAEILAVSKRVIGMTATLINTVVFNFLESYEITASGKQAA